MANVLHLTHRYWPVKGGSEQYLWQIARRQAKAGHQVTVVTTNAQDLAYFWDPGAGCLEEGEATEDGVRVIRVPVQHLPGAPRTFGALRHLEVGLSRVPGLARRAGFLARWAPYLPELTPTLSRLGNDWQMVFGWNVTFDGLFEEARRMASHSGGRFLAIPFLHLGEGPGSPLRRYYTMPHQIELLRNAQGIIVQTHLEQTYLSEQGIPHGRLAIVGAGIDPAALSGGDASAFRQKHGLQGTIVTYIGPQTFDKGSIHLLEAANRLRRARQSFTLVLAGSMMADFQARWARLPAEDRDHIRVLGIITEDEKRDLLAATDVFALPSRTESFGIVLLEAWYYGKPVIGARAGAIPAVIVDGVDGRLIPFCDAKALATAITEVLDSPVLAQRWGENGRQKVVDKYTWDAIYERFSTALSDSGVGRADA